MISNFNDAALIVQNWISQKIGIPVSLGNIIFIQLLELLDPFRQRWGKTVFQNLFLALLEYPHLP